MCFKTVKPHISKQYPSYHHHQTIDCKAIYIKTLGYEKPQSWERKTGADRRTVCESAQMESFAILTELVRIWFSFSRAIL